ncbi:MAG: hypothetical protein HY900_27820, partial [Deltaproteobacteria bacterium]|nr:hypothetical protein [Deltaproteobacteria bacterium]
MPIFSRRVLQRLIDENHRFLEQGHIERHVKRLNEESDLHSMSHEWEVAILNALGKVGQLAHEKTTSRRASAPDVRLKLPSGTEFVADITAISDVSLEKLNPVDKFADEIYQEFRRQGLPAGRLSIRVEGRLEGKRPNQKMRLALPADDAIPTIVQTGLRPLVDAVRANPEQPAILVIAEGTVDVKLEYNPHGPAGLSHPSYTVPYSLTSNPLYNRLVDKATTLRKSGFRGTKGIILCDSDCDSLGEPHGYHQHFSRNQILTAFFGEYRFISFVW